MKCPTFTRKIRQVLTDMQLNDALQELDLLQSAAVADRIGKSAVSQLVTVGHPGLTYILWLGGRAVRTSD